MKKTYRFKVEAEAPSRNDDLVADLLAEVNQERSELDLTKKINAESSQIHMEILKEFCNELDKVFHEGLGFDIFGDLQHIKGANGYYTPMARLYGGLNGKGIIIVVRGLLDREFSDSKYTTYTGEYQIELRINFDAITYAPLPLSSNHKVVENVADVVDYLRYDIKKELQQNHSGTELI